MFESYRMRRMVSVLALASLSFLATFIPARAEVTRDDRASLVEDVPLNCWQDPSHKPTSIVIAIHGLTMHGGVFDAVVRRLAERGAIVYAPDLRGYGRWFTDAQSNDKNKDSAQLDYDQSYQDLVGIIKTAKERNPDLPLFCIGESLGADLALHAAADMPDKVEGLILSSPAIKRRYFVLPVVANSGSVMVRPTRPVDLIPYIKKFASEDPQVVDGALQDPLVRKRMTAFELFETCCLVRQGLTYAKRVPNNTPVLVIQGSKDRMVRSNAVVLLLEQLKSTDQTVRWFSNRGHLLLETSYVKPDTLDTVEGWLTEHVKKPPIAQASVTATALPAD